MISMVDKDTGERVRMQRRKWNHITQEYDIEYLDETFDASLAMDNVDHILGERGKRPRLKRVMGDSRHYDERHGNYEVIIEGGKYAV